MEYWQLKQKQSLPLAQKIRLSEMRIQQWYDYWHGQVYVAFSGGKDSTVLLHLVRSMYPEIPAVFSDTGLEYPEIRQFVKTISNVIWIKPKMTFKQVIEKYGYPVVSKEQSQFIQQCQNPTENNWITRRRRLTGIDAQGVQKKSGMISKKWKYLIDAPFRISNNCCDALKKRPFYQYEKETEYKPYIGTMACDSFLRRQSYLKNQCNMFAGKQQSRPLSVWLQDDIWQYIKENNLSYSSIYDMGESNTGCMFCMFGVHMEKQPNRFQRMASSHLKQYNYCINKLGCGKVLDYIGVPYIPQRPQRPKRPQRPRLVP